MERKKFLKSACTVGLCSCFGIPAISPHKIHAQEKETDPEITKLNKKMEFVHKRFAKLIEILNSKLDKDQKNQILEDLGRACAEMYSAYYTKYENNLDGLLEDMQSGWDERVDYDQENQVITIIGKKTENCFCALADKSLTPVEFCACSLGWQKGVFEAVSGKKAEVEILESVLRGGERCSFKIKLS
jgi:predicted hydrocarbon binding protein